MTPTVSAHFDKFTLTADPFDETETEDACDSEDDAVTAEVVSILPPEHVDLQSCPHAVYRNTDSLGGCRYYSELVHPGEHYELCDGVAVRTAEGAAWDAFYASYKPEDVATPPLPQPPRQRIGGGRKIGLLQTALLSTLFFCTFMFLTDECDATAVTAQLAQPLTSEIACDFATPPAQGLVVSQYDILDYDTFTENFYEDPGPGRSEIEDIRTTTNYISEFAIFEPYGGR
ncbi:hypothetical protein CYMTET_5672 [Cymbomonas tetramitiformis]|uniref:Uncharacterized protein n=1 Tax=Cymbomonas tetramitiformis TaxID=36881 RepID=A0AAE0LJ83_9CHLO|nr:hypothetical protein CYMTET_5672 [Cymbomonas tetramitiformis]